MTPFWGYGVEPEGQRPLRKKLYHEVLEKALRLHQAPLSVRERSLKRAIFCFDTDWPLISTFRERREKIAPVNVAKSGKLRNVILRRIGQDPHILEFIPIDQR